VPSVACRNIGRYIHPLAECAYALRISSWKTPREEKTEDTAPLFAKMARVEGLALRVVEDERNDPGFRLLSLIVGWMAILQRRIGVAERWARRAARKREMLASEALRMKMCDRLGGVGALERWEERAKLALTFSRQAGDPAAAQRAYRRDDGKKENQTNATSSPRQKPGSPDGVREFALARLPGCGVRRVATRNVRAAPRHETPIPVWPCEVMPERFAREWWKAAPEGPSQTNKNTDAFPEFGSAKYPGAGEGGPDGNGARDRLPGLNPGRRGSVRRGLDVGGPGSRPGAMLCASIA